MPPTVLMISDEFHCHKQTNFVISFGIQLVFSNSAPLFIAMGIAVASLTIAVASIPDELISAQKVPSGQPGPT